jgi:hypothetical protein
MKPAGEQTRLAFLFPASLPGAVTAQAGYNIAMRSAATRPEQ